jgi:hypothetical protein
MAAIHPWAERALHHARHIAGRIGPRGPATSEEQQAIDYAQQQMQQLGLRDVRVEAFSATTSGWLPVTVIFSIAVWGVFACWSLFYLTQTRLIGALVAVGLCLAALSLLYLEVTRHDHLVRRVISRATSYNAIGRLTPDSSIRQRIVLLSNADTLPSAAVLKTPRRARLFCIVFYLGTASLMGSVVLYLLGGLDMWEWAFVFAGIFGLLQSAVIIQSLRADRGDFSSGANHNASGLGATLALAERLLGTPLQNTEVWIVCCGAHTTGGSGLRELLQRHTVDLRDAWFIGFEGVGTGDRLVYFNREGWLRRSVHPAMRDLIERTARAHPDQKIEAQTIWLDTVVAAATWRGCKSVCLSVYSERNGILFRHQHADTAERLQSPAFTTALEFGWRLLQEIDRG